MSTISETTSTSSKSRAAKDKDPFEENGLMDEIERLVAPPVLDPKSLKFTKALKYRKPRAVNVSHCQSCLGDGDLVCCDRCPASYHLRCHQPPLEEEDIPSKGKWLCHRCQIAPLDVDDEFSVGGLQNGHVTPSSAVADLLLDAKQAAMRKEKRLQAAKLTEDDRNSLAIRKFLNTKHPDLNHSIKKIPPMQLLAEAAQALNAQEFRLPAELQTIQERFPGRELLVADSTSSSTSGTQQQQQSFVPAPHEYDSNGLIPLPARKCHFCRLSCR